MYNTDTTLDVNRAVWGADDVAMNPADSLLRIHLNSSFAQYLFANPDVVSSQTSFIRAVNGLSIQAASVGAGSTGYVVPVDLTHFRTALVLYYHNTSGAKTLSFSVGQSDVRVNTYKAFFGGGPISQQIMDSTGKYDKVYLSGMNLTQVKIDIPYLRNLVGDGTIALHKAEFIFPKTDSIQDPYNTANYEPKELILRPRGAKGKDNLDRFSDDLLTGGYYGGEWNASTQEYRFRLTRYLQDWLLRYNKGETRNFPGLNLSVPVDDPAAPSRVILNTPHRGGTRKARLVISYTKLSDK